MAKRKVAKKTRKATKTTRKVAKTSKVAKKKSAARSTGKGPWPAAQLRDYKALEKRAATLGKSLTDADFDAKGNPVKPAWSRLLGDLDAWAAKYKVKLSRQEHDHADGGTGPAPRSLGGGCPGSFQTKPVVSYDAAERRRADGANLLHPHAQDAPRPLCLFVYRRGIHRVARRAD